MADCRAPLQALLRAVSTSAPEAAFLPWRCLSANLVE